MKILRILERNNMKLINKTDRIFVAGHNGMVGKSILRTLNRNGYGNILTVERKKLDLANEREVLDWFKLNKPDIVILAAAKVGGIYANNKYQTEFLLENLKIQNNVISQSWQNEVKRFLFLGSSCIYPKYAKQPIEEEDLLSGSLEQTNQSYAIAKIAGIKLCEALRTQYKFDAISLMPTNLYGPGDNYHPLNSHVLPALIRKFYNAKVKKLKSVQCWGTGSPMREFLHVDDLGEACLFVLEKWDPDNQNSPRDLNGNPHFFLNVGTGSDISIKELTEIIANQVKFDGEIKWDISKPDGTPKKLLNINKIQTLGWNPKISLVDGIQDTIEDYKKNLDIYG